MSVTTQNSLVTFGINSICQDGKHVIFIDFDEHDYIVIANVCQSLQKTYDLSDFYMFTTNKGFHAICLDKFFLNQIVNMLIGHIEIDQEYIKFAKKRNNFTLRWGIDKQPYSNLINNSTVHQKSMAHYIFLRDIVDGHVIFYQKNDYDHFGLLEIQAYRSEKNGSTNIKL